MTVWNAEPYLTPQKVGPLRAVVAVMRGVLVLGFLALMLIPCLLLKWVEPLLGGRQPRYAVVRLWAVCTLRLLGVRRVVHGALPPAGTALVANHSTWMDILVFSSIGQVTFVAKSEVSRWPGIGWSARMMNTMFVERRAGAVAGQTVEMAQRLAQGQQLLFFPEGTSTDGLRVLTFKSALFSAFLQIEGGAMVQPVAATYVPAPHLPAAFYGWWGDMDMGSNLWTLLAHSYGGVVHLSFSRPVAASDFPDRKGLARYCGDQVRADHAANASGVNTPG